MFMPLAVLDLLAEDWVRSRKESARTFGDRESRVVAWAAALRRRFQGPPPQAAAVAAAAPGKAPRSRAA